MQKDLSDYFDGFLKTDTKYWKKRLADKLAKPQVDEERDALDTEEDPVSDEDMSDFLSDTEYEEVQPPSEEEFQKLQKELGL